MRIDVSNLEVGEYFTTARGETFKVTSREDYPFIYAKCISQPNEYEHEATFAYEMVEVDKNAKFYKEEFVEITPKHYALTLKKQW